MKLNVGCGRNIMPGWTNVDCVAAPGVDVVVDLDKACVGDAAPLLMPGFRDKVDEFLLSHVIEHLRNPLGVMQELWALAKPGAVMTIRCPHGASDDADEDPTHVRRVFPGSMGYWGQPFYWRADYGYRGDWYCDELELHMAPGRSIKAAWDERNAVREMVARLHAVKPMRLPMRELQNMPRVRYIT